MVVVASPDSSIIRRKSLTEPEAYPDLVPGTPARVRMEKIDAWAEQFGLTDEALQELGAQLGIRTHAGQVQFANEVQYAVYLIDHRRLHPRYQTWPGVNSSSAGAPGSVMNQLEVSAGQRRWLRVVRQGSRDTYGWQPGAPEGNFTLEDIARLNVEGLYDYFGPSDEEINDEASEPVEEAADPEPATD